MTYWTNNRMWHKTGYFLQTDFCEEKFRACTTKLGIWNTRRKRIRYWPRNWDLNSNNSKADYLLQSGYRSTNSPFSIAVKIVRGRERDSSRGETACNKEPSDSENGHKNFTMYKLYWLFILQADERIWNKDSMETWWLLNLQSSYLPAEH